MIRISQTFLITEAIRALESAKWTCLYYDLPGGSRSGVGLRAEINSVFERVLNLSPDGLFIKDSTLLLLEVDKALTKTYFDKFDKYHRKQTELIDRIDDILSTRIDRLLFGFATSNPRTPESIPGELGRFLYLAYKNGKYSMKWFNSF